MKRMILILLFPLVACQPSPDCALLATEMVGIEADRQAGLLSDEAASSLLTRGLQLRASMGCR
jgi:hypothetical protein